MRINVYMKGRNESYDAKGIFDGSNMIVLKGSKIKDAHFKERIRISEEIRNNPKLVKDNIVLEDITFASPSTAANFVADTVCNGLRNWRTMEGITLKNYINNK